MLHSQEEKSLKLIAAKIRQQVIRMSHHAQAPHLGSSLSCVDILVAAYWNILRIDPTDPFTPSRDRFILSKGHAAMSLYAVLAERGFFSSTLLSSFAKPGSPLAEQPSPNCAPGIELATGSLGHGLSVGVGLALGARIQNLPYRVIVTMGDGECNEGSIWEAALFAPAQGLDRLAVIIDYNKWQATGRSNEVMSLSSLAHKWKAFGWNTCEVNGHDLEELTDSMKQLDDNTNKPLAIIAHTIKGKGVSFMEDDNNWHYRIPTTEEVKAAHLELNLERLK